MRLTLPDSGAGTTPDGRRHAPSAVRNAQAILEVLLAHAPARGRALELAAGSGQHAAVFATALPGLDWQPTDVNPENLPSIRAWAAWANETGGGVPNLRPPIVLDASAPGWAAHHGGQDLVLAVNLLHLIPDRAAQTVLAQAAACLAPGGVVMVYGPFLRDGRATSEGDAAFHASLRAQDPAIGYKDVDWACGCLAAAGLQVARQDMPANNLMLIARAPRHVPDPAPQ